MASTDAKPIPQKNVAYRVTFPIFDVSGALVSGASGLDSEVSKDAGTFADCTNEATEIATSSGIYYLDLTSTEMNADTVAVIVKTSTSGANTAVLVFYPEEAGDIRVNVTAYGGTAGTFSSGRPEVNATHLGGTSQTGRDIGASVLLSSGTGTGQLSITSGVANVNVLQISGDATAADNLEAYCDGTTPQPVNVTQFGGTNATATGGRPEVNTSHIAGAAVSTSSAQIGVNVVNAGGTAWGSGAITAASIATGAFTAAKFASGAFDAVWSVAARLLTAGTNIVLAKGTGVTGFTDLDAAGMRSAVGLSSANLDTQLSTIDTVVDSILVDTGTTLDGKIDTIDTVADAIKAKTDSLTFTVAGQVDANIQRINDVALTGDGQPGTEFGV